MSCLLLDAGSAGELIALFGPDGLEPALIRQSIERSSGCLFHVPLLGGHDEPRTLCYRIGLTAPITGSTAVLLTWLVICSERSVDKHDHFLRKPSNPYLIIKFAFFGPYMCPKQVAATINR